MRRRFISLLAAGLLPAALLCSCGADKAETAADIPAKPDASFSAGESAGASEDAFFAKEAAEEAVDYMPDAVLNDAEPAAPADDDGAPSPEGEIPESQSESVTEPPPDDGSQPFVLTAGEWNDNANWGFFTNLVHTGRIAFPSYGLDPVHKMQVTVNNGGTPAANQTVTLLDGETAIWKAKTDKSGTAYLFYPANGREAKQYTLRTEGAADTVCEVPADDTSQQGGSSVPQLSYTVDTANASVSYQKTEVMFILDTTGSMGDEITYLQKDFSAIAGEVADENMTFSVNFYKDEGDTYVTRCNPFTDDITAVQSTLNQEYADGGGDAPEAVAQILDEVITNGSWSADTNKIAFLIFDAPPHSGSKNEEMLQKAAASAAAQGIHLVPVVASNAERETELFGRALAIMTNSNYVFLTDDSGIGEAHLEPIIGDYQVELLHDIIVRNIRGIAS